MPGRDPISEWFDRGARDFMTRVYARPGQWVGTRVAAPSPQEIATAMVRLGINVRGRDHLGRPRWVAGFVRACYYQHKWHRTGNAWHDEKRLTANQGRGIQYEIGHWMPQRGIVPPGYAIRFRSKPGGAAAQKAARKMPDSKRIFLEDGELGPKWADPSLRDW